MQREKLNLSATVTRLLRATYDPRTFRLVRLTTTRPPSPISKTLPRLMDPGVLQDLSYTYDATGNITEIRDNAYEPAFFNNQQVDAVSRHSYDALYRLIESTGRENAQANGAPTQVEAPPFAVQFPVGEAKTLRNYTQSFTYDSVGNIDQVKHVAGVDGSWTKL